MKKFFTLCLMSLWATCLSVVSADGIEFRISIDDPARVTLSVNEELKSDISEGLNTFTVSPGSTIRVEARDGYFLKSVKSFDGSSYFDEWVVEMKFCDIHYYSDWDETYYVESCSEEEARTAHCTVKIDDATKVKLVRSATQSTVELTNGENQVAFIPDIETELVLSVLGEKPLFEVKHNDELLTSGAPYRITVKEGDRIEITAGYPEEEYPVHFVYEGDDAEYFVTGVTVDGEYVLDYNSPEFKVRMGATVTVFGNTTEWRCDAFEINGVQNSFFGSCSFTVVEETTIRIVVYKYTTMKVYIDVDVPENVTVYRGYSYNGDVLSLNPGRNEVSLVRNTPLIHLRPNDGCYLESVVCDGEAIEDLRVPPVRVDYLGDGSEITIRTGIIDRNKRAAIFVDNYEVVADYFEMQRSDRTAVENIGTGYTEFSFYDGDNNFTVATGGQVPAVVYLNGLSLAPIYPESPNYQFSLSDGDVLKVFFNGAPVSHEVSFEVADAADAQEAVAVVYDRLRGVDAWAAGFSVQQGTEVALSKKADRGFTVTVDQTALAPDDDGVVRFTVNADTRVKVEVDEKSGISDILKAADRMEGRVYNLQGVVVAERATADRIAALPAGIYIVQGKKFIKR